MHNIYHTDWREQGQEKYLPHCLWKKGKYFLNTKSNDHDHCEYCWEKFCLTNLDCIKEGYYCNNGERWICIRCWHDFSMKHLLHEV